MKLYRFSPILSEKRLWQAANHIHLQCHVLCKNTFGKILKNSGNLGIFCHYEKEYEFLTALSQKLTYPSDDPDQKYFLLKHPFTTKAQGEIPETTYTHLYIRKPDPYRHHAGDLDFSLSPAQYLKLKQKFLDGKPLSGARIFPRPDLDMIELFNPDIDALAYVSQTQESIKVRKRQKDAPTL